MLKISDGKETTRCDSVRISFETATLIFLTFPYHFDFNSARHDAILDQTGPLYEELICKTCFNAFANKTCFLVRRGNKKLKKKNVLSLLCCFVCLFGFSCSVLFYFVFCFFVFVCFWFCFRLFLFFILYLFCYYERE